MATLHARLSEGSDPDRAIGSIQMILRERFRIEHATVQLERFDCIDTRCAQ
jgi:cobalt-zinc-cadmium efflux system protein